MGKNFPLESDHKLLSLISAFLKVENSSMETKLTEICVLLKQEIKTYDWVGFYFSNHETKTLHLIAFAGIPTDHTTIPFGKGICGQVAVSNKNFVVPDVLAQDNYLACSIDVRSEIVIPLFLKGKNIGQIDIDSKKTDPFTSKDSIFLETVCALISKTYNTSLLYL